MITKPEKIIKRIIKAVGLRQSALVIGDWNETLINGIKENQNSITISSSTKDLNDNTFTRIIVDYSLLCDRRGNRPIAPTTLNNISFYKEIRRLLLPTGMLIVSANSEPNILEKLFSSIKKENTDISIKKIKPKVLQDQIHDNGFLIDGYYGYPSGHLLMMAIIQNKNVTTLFTSEKQETIHI